jgi:glycosyltransferase involved in cell wall biosynthesis
VREPGVGTPSYPHTSPLPGGVAALHGAPTRVALICQHLTMGGAEELVLGIATHLPRERYDLRVLCLTEEGIIARELREQGVRVDVLAGEPGPRDPRAFIRLASYLRAWKPRIVHTFLLNAVLYGRLAAMVAGVPAIFAAEQNVYRGKAAKHVLMERLLAKRTYRVIACCRAVGEFYQQQVKLPPDKTAVILNAVRYDQFLPLPGRATSRAALGLEPDAMTIGSIGRLTRQKGHDILLHAVKNLSARLPDLQVVIAGQGEARPSLEALVSDLKLSRNVHFVGMRRDREHFYGALDAFVLPSRWEGLSLALAEAVGAGVPTVATDVGGNAEVIQSGCTGLLVPPENRENLEQALDTLLADAELRRRFSERGIAEVRPRFEISRHVEQLEALYAQALAA